MQGIVGEDALPCIPVPCSIEHSNKDNFPNKDGRPFVGFTIEDKKNPAIMIVCAF